MILRFRSKQHLFSSIERSVFSHSYGLDGVVSFPRLWLCAISHDRTRSRRATALPEAAGPVERYRTNAPDNNEWRRCKSHTAMMAWGSLTVAESFAFYFVLFFFTQGTLLDDDKLVQQLETLKREAAEVADKAATADGVMQEVQRTSDFYLPLASMTSAMYFSVERLSDVDHLYQFSPVNVNRRTLSRQHYE